MKDGLRANGMPDGIYVHDVPRAASCGGALSSCAVPSIGRVVVDARRLSRPVTVLVEGSGALAAVHLHALYSHVMQVLAEKEPQPQLQGATCPAGCQGCADGEPL